LVKTTIPKGDVNIPQLVNGNSTLGNFVSLSFVDCVVVYEVPTIPSSFKKLGAVLDVYMNQVYIYSNAISQASILINNTVFQSGSITNGNDLRLFSSEKYSLSNAQRRRLGAQIKWTLLHFTNCSVNIINSTFGGVPVVSRNSLENAPIDFKALLTWSFGLVTLSGCSSVINSSSFRFFFHF
jgi:hypothetical protein